MGSLALSHRRCRHGLLSASLQCPTLRPMATTPTQPTDSPRVFVISCGQPCSVTLTQEGQQVTWQALPAAGQTSIIVPAQATLDVSEPSALLSPLPFDKAPVAITITGDGGESMPEEAAWIIRDEDGMICSYRNGGLLQSINQFRTDFDYASATNAQVKWVNEVAANLGKYAASDTFNAEISGDYQFWGLGTLELQSAEFSNLVTANCMFANTVSWGGAKFSLSLPKATFEKLETGDKMFQARTDINLPCATFSNAQYIPFRSSRGMRNLPNATFANATQCRLGFAQGSANYLNAPRLSLPLATNLESMCDGRVSPETFLQLNLRSASNCTGTFYLDESLTAAQVKTIVYGPVDDSGNWRVDDGIYTTGWGIKDYRQIDSSTGAILGPATTTRNLGMSLTKSLESELAEVLMHARNRGWTVTIKSVEK